LLCKYINLHQSGIIELIQTTTGKNPILERSMILKFRCQSRRMEIVKAAIIFDVSRSSLFTSLTMDIQIH